MVNAPHASTKQDILQHLMKQGQAAAQQLAETLDISPQATRRHLKDLEAEGLIEHQSVQTGMGRPQHIYQLSHAGRDRFPHRYNEFAVSLLDTLAETVGQDQVGSILRKQWERKALEYRQNLGDGSLRQRVANLVQMRLEEGYMAEWHPVDSESDSSNSNGNEAGGDRFILTEHNCAISEVAESFPSVCDNELEMFAVALPDCTVERTHWLIDGEHRCGYLIQKRAH